MSITSNVSDIMLNASSFSNTSDVCVPLRKPYILGLSFFPAFGALENLLFLFAIVLHRRALKFNNVYRYVASAFSANLMISLLAFYHFINYFFGFEPSEPNAWWAFRKGMQLALSLVLCGNIGLLIYGIHDSTYIIGRVTPTYQPVLNRSSSYRRRKAKGLILGVWSLPTLYGLLSMTSWNCTADQCSCTLSFQSGNPICSERFCSQLYTPMAKSYLMVVVLLWALECFGLLVLMINFIISSIKSEKKSFTDMHWCEVLLKIVSTNKMVFIIFALFLGCTAPIMIFFALDFSIPNINFNRDVANFVIPLPILYCIFSPILLANQLSGVRSALWKVFHLSCRNRNRRRRSQRSSTTGLRPASVSISEYPKSTPV